MPSDEARQARRVDRYLARGLSRAEPVEIGETILERPAEVLAAADEIGAALDGGRDLAALVVEAEVELLALAGVAEARGYPLPTTASAKTTAMRIVVDGRDSFTAPHSDLVALAAADLARLRAEPTPPTTPALSPFMRAAKDYDLAVLAAREARFTARERGAVAARERAFNAPSPFSESIMSKSPESKTKAGAPAPQSREEAASFIRRIGENARIIARFQAEMNDAIARLKEDAENAAAPRAAEIEQWTEGLRAWCDANRAALTDGENASSPISAPARSNGGSRRRRSRSRMSRT